MLVDSGTTSSNTTACSSPSNNSIHTFNYEASSNDLPSTIVWTQTEKSITLQININHCRVILTERYLKLSNRSNTITLPLYGGVYIQQYDIEQMISINRGLDRVSSTSTSNAIRLTLQKQCLGIWPHLLMQQTDREIEFYLSEASFFVHIYQQTESVNSQEDLYDTLDFETVINGQGEKTGLE